MESTNENNNENSKGVRKLKLKKMLKDSYTLLKVDVTMKNIEKMKDVRIKPKLKSYLDVSLEKLSGSSTKHNKQNITIKENMQTINNSCLEEQQPTINRLPNFNKVPQINHNDVGTKETFEQVQEMHQLINQLQEILEQDEKNLFGPTNNLLFIHNHLSKLELSRDNTMQEASNASQIVIDKLQSYFNRLDEFSHYFTNYLWKLSKILIPLAKNGHASTIISSIVKIIEFEEDADERAEYQRDSNLEITKKRLRVIKSYRTNFLIQLDNSIVNLFEEKFQKYRDSSTQLLNKLDFIFDDLILVKDEINPFFPSNYNIILFFILAYHRNVYKFIKEILKNDPDTKTNLSLIGWVRRYYTFMEKKMYINENLMEPNLLGGQEQSMIDDYLDLIRNKVQEWKTNLMESNIKEFTQRQKRPELDSKNLVGLPGAPIFISMIRQQIDLVIESENYQLLTGVINVCCVIMLEVQEIWINLLKSELQRHLDNQEECEDELIIYIIALANDQLGFADFIDILLKQFTSSLPEEFIKNITNMLNNTMDGFLNVATSAINTILDIIFNDLKKPFRELHTAKWYKGNIMAVIVLTLEDYTEECHSYLKPYNFYNLIIDMLNRFVIAYIESMRNKAVKFRMPHCIDKMRQDIHSISEFFGQYIGTQELNSQLDVINKLHDFLGTTIELVYLDYYSLRRAYGDVPRKYLKIILSKRDDLDIIKMKRINKILKAKAAEVREYNGKQTVFSKIIIKDPEGTELKDLQEPFQPFHNMRLRSLRRKKKKKTRPSFHDQNS
ncbi:exocyst complex component Sec6-domain-containing protein [Glomus cerebriforme]|uniref:Exocyst complex component Sec6-domain-containing protein n=1 Tax=Glomus cerebriforme TaxID=658196 RepID=A0A397T379_9GLOM|nr:exocyst complex component Sec6-domain-containing protein [Glomus cerebriforme]